ncbi:MAG: pre-peptidase C-terminal domain-containing protein, partial [Planctomycetes bacterium]|nr:pre-peptidase C-terminal domain-containing protein [Planctomycetota bacterium]
DGNGVLLALGLDVGAKVKQAIVNFRAPATETYYVSVAGAAEATYTLLVLRGAGFDLEPNSQDSEATDISRTSQALGRAALGGLDAVDVYAIDVATGDTLTIETTTPGDGTGQPLNDLDPLLELYDPNGVLVGSNDNGAADGRNALINHVATQTGTYHIHVSPVVGGGDYVLTVTGASESATKELLVEQASVADGAILTAFPNTVQLTFDSALLLSTVDAADLTANGAAADSATVIDANTLLFDISSSDSGDGGYALALAADGIQSVSGAGNAAFSLSFTVDTTSPVVTASSIDSGQIVEPGHLTYTVTFSEDIATADLGSEDVALVETGFETIFLPTSFVHDNGTDTLTVEFEGLYDGRYMLVLASGPTAFRDIVGHGLNGAPSFPLPSGQNDPLADDFVVDFIVDAVGAEAYPVPLAPELPMGSLIYDPAIHGMIHQAGDTDDYEILIDGNQTVTVLVESSELLQSTIALYGPGDVLLGSATAAAAGAPAVLQTVAATATGTYSVRIGGAGGSTGSYTAQLILNAAVEEEGHGGASNHDLASAQDLDGSSIALDAGADRLAVLGETGVGMFVDVTDIGFDGTGLNEPVKGLAYLSPGLFLLSDGSFLYEMSTDGSSTIRLGAFSDWTTGLALVDGSLYAAGGYSDQLRTIDPGTGADLNTVTLLLPGSTVVGVNALAADPTTGTLWAILRLNDESHGWGSGPRELTIIDVDTGVVTPIGNTGDRFSAIAFDGLGRLHGITGTGGDVPDTLYRLSTTDATSTLMTSLVPGGGGEALALNPDDGLLYRAARGDWAGEGVLQAITITEGEDVADFYSFSLDAGQAATLVVEAEGSSGIGLELWDASETLLALGMASASNVDGYIQDFVPSLAGTYYARVVSPTPENSYALVITRGATFELQSVAGGQDISHTGNMLGYVGGVDGAINVAVLGGGGSQPLVNQLNDSTAYPFTAGLVSRTQIDTLDELNAYDAVIISD